jgi:hypothetical protein
MAFSKYASDVVVFHLRGRNVLWTERIKVIPVNSQLRSLVYLRGITFSLSVCLSIAAVPFVTVIASGERDSQIISVRVSSVIPEYRIWRVCKFHEMEQKTYRNVSSASAKPSAAYWFLAWLIFTLKTEVIRSSETSLYRRRWQHNNYRCENLKSYTEQRMRNFISFLKLKSWILIIFTYGVKRGRLVMLTT